MKRHLKNKLPAPTVGSARKLLDKARSELATDPRHGLAPVVSVQRCPFEHLSSTTDLATTSTTFINDITIITFYYFTSTPFMKTGRRVHSRTWLTGILVLFVQITNTLLGKLLSHSYSLSSFTTSDRCQLVRPCLCHARDIFMASP